MNILSQIKAYKLQDIENRKKERPISTVEDFAKLAPSVRLFRQSIARNISTGYALIAEIKKASPSKGIIRQEFVPAALAESYAKGGAACLSVLTDAPSFQGADHYLTQARDVVDLPVLRKDFFYDPYQVVEARAIHADCILIIMASVSDTQAAELEDAAQIWGMDAIIEVHDETELERACKMQSKLIGVNNRNLKTFETDLSVTKRLSALAPSDKIIIAESGISTPKHLSDLANHGVRSFLVGESLMRHNDVEKATKHLLS